MARPVINNQQQALAALAARKDLTSAQLAAANRLLSAGKFAALAIFLGDYCPVKEPAPRKPTYADIASMITLTSNLHYAPKPQFEKTSFVACATSDGAKQHVTRQ